MYQLFLSIHPPIQGGNITYESKHRIKRDTPSHTGRKLGKGEDACIQVRYTLPYREETLGEHCLPIIFSIHPPIQGGNVYTPGSDTKYNDTPSHTGRKLPPIGVSISSLRYTLPYREETLSAYAAYVLPAIHPPIQGGNLIEPPEGQEWLDTPSHTGRKQQEDIERKMKFRYTLPYREETLNLP